MSLPSTKDLKWMDFIDAGASIFSTCSKRQYFAVILDKQGHQIGSGWNGGPKGMKHCNEGGCKRAYEESKCGSVYDNCIAIHAEANAILHSNYSQRQEGATLYVNGPPCFGCAKLIANAGITKLVYKVDKDYADWPNVHVFLVEAGVELVEVE